MFDPEIEALPRDRLRKLQDQRVCSLVEYACRKVEFYRNLLRTAGTHSGDVQGVDDLSKLPFTRKDDLRRNYPLGLNAVEAGRLARIHVSSGTTGKPTVVGYTRHDLEIFAEVNARSLTAAGARPGMTLHNAYGYGLFTGGLGFHAGAERLGMTVVPVSGGVTQRQIMLILDFRPDVLACTPSYAQRLAEEFRQRGISPQEISLRYAVLGAEPWTEAVRRDVETGLGVETTNCYGLSEIIGPGVSQQCLEGREGSHIWEDHFYPEIVDPHNGQPLEEGREGVLVLTTLTKEALPLIRYWTGDLCSLSRRPCPCGRTHVRMSPIKGRSDDMLIIRGVNLYPTQIESLLQDIDEASPHYQLILSRQGALDRVDLKVEVRPPAFPESASPELRRRIARRIRETLGLNIHVHLLPPGRLPRSDGGKLNRVEDRRSQQERQPQRARNRGEESGF